MKFYVQGYLNFIANIFIFYQYNLKDMFFQSLSKYFIHPLIEGKTIHNGQIISMPLSSCQILLFCLLNLKEQVVPNFTVFSLILILCKKVIFYFFLLDNFFYIPIFFLSSVMFPYLFVLYSLFNCFSSSNKFLYSFFALSCKVSILAR